MTEGLEQDFERVWVTISRPRDAGFKVACKIAYLAGRSDEAASALSKLMEEIGRPVILAPKPDGVGAPLIIVPRIQDPTKFTDDTSPDVSHEESP